jgi:3D (Asp-Asp-Asp) domain-containing protein
MIKTIAFTLSLALNIGFARGSVASEAASSFELPPPGRLEGAEKQQFYATAYFVFPAEQSGSETDPLLLGPGGASHGVRISRSDWCRAAVEGSLAVRLKDGTRRAFAYSGTGTTRIADCSTTLARMAARNPAQVRKIEKSLFVAAPDDAPFGVGARSQYRLVPYRSIAIDTRDNAPFSLGDVLFIPALKGFRFTLPGGDQHVHDGYVMAVDAGGSIKGQHIDFFKGAAANDSVPGPLVSSSDNLKDAYVVDDPAVVEALKKAHDRDL